MTNSTLSYVLRSLFVVLASVTIGAALSQAAGLSIQQSMLIALPVGFFAASLLTLLYMAKAGAAGNQNRQLAILLVIEFLLVPIASAAAIAAYFM